MMDQYVLPDGSPRKLPGGFANWEKWELNQPIQEEILNPFPCENLTVNHLQKILREYSIDSVIQESTTKDGILGDRTVECSNRSGASFEVAIDDFDDCRYLNVSYELVIGKGWARKMDLETFEDLLVRIGHIDDYRIVLSGADNAPDFKASFMDGFELPEHIETSEIIERIIKMHDGIITLINKVIDELLGGSTEG